MSDTELKKAEAAEKPKAALDAKILDAQRSFEQAKKNQLEGQVNDLKLQVAQFDGAMQKVVDGVNGQAMKLMQQIMALEQALLSISKITTALSQALIKKDIVSDAEIMTELRATEDKLEESRIEGLKNAGVLVLSQTSDENSILVVRQELLNADGTKQLVSDYRTVELSNMKQDDPLRKELLNKGAGDTIAVTKDNESFLFTVKAVYSFLLTVKAVYKMAEQGSLPPET